MDKLNFNTFVKILKCDLILALLIAVCAQLAFRGFALTAVFGIFIAYFNFVLNGTVTSILFKRMTSLSILICIISYLFRIILVAVIGYIIFTNNKQEALIFVIGYVTHFASLVIISLQGLICKEGK